MLFHKISLEDQCWYKKVFEEEHVEACDYIFASNFVWAEAYEVVVAEVEGCGIIRYSSDKNLCYSFPVGGTWEQKRKAIRQLKEYCQKRGEVLIFSPITEEQRQLLLQHYPGEFEIDGDRNWYDYVYETKILAELKGKKLAAKRNYIHRFEKEGDWSYEPLTEDNKEQCWELELEWIKSKGDKGKEDIWMEKQALRKALDYFDELQLCGGVLRQHGTVVAFCIAEAMNDNMMVIHFEKARTDVVGAFQMINQQFAKNQCMAYSYINREDDAGDMGLRKAKSSYRFYQFIKKYTATQSEYTYVMEKDFEDVKRIWSQTFGDDENYISFYLEKRWTPENMMCMRENGKVVSFANLLPGKIRTQGTWKDILYLYAVATDPAFQGKGYASKLIRHIQGKYREPIVVVPATKDLKSFYERFGFWEAFQESRQEYVKHLSESEKDTVYTECGVEWAEEYRQARDSFFDQEGYVAWDTEAIAYAIEENRICDGKLVNNRDKGFVLYRLEEEELIIMEATMSLEDLADMIQAILQKEGCNKAVMSNQGGMIYHKDNNLKTSTKGYLNLVLG